VAAAPAASADSPAPALAAAPAAALPPISIAQAGAQAWAALQRRVALDTLSYYAEAGDVQMCVTLCRALGPAIERAVGSRRLQQWHVSYIDMLHRLQLWSPASTVMARASDEGIRRMNQMHTHLTAACASCSRDVAAAVPAEIVKGGVETVRAAAGGGGGAGAGASGRGREAQLAGVGSDESAAPAAGATRASDSGVGPLEPGDVEGDEYEEGGADGEAEEDVEAGAEAAEGEGEADRAARLLEGLGSPFQHLAGGGPRPRRRQPTALFAVDNGAVVRVRARRRKLSEVEAAKAAAQPHAAAAQAQGGGAAKSASAAQSAALAARERERDREREEERAKAEATLVPVLEPGCGELQAVAPARCGSCRDPLSTCSVCLQPVRGVYVWCQGCGHGGHLEHLVEWFAAFSSLCPAGCMHVCHLQGFEGATGASVPVAGGGPIAGI